MSSKLIEALLKADILISIATFEEDVRMDEVDKIRSEIKAAISAPPRNCDRFANTKKAYGSFRKFCRGNFCVDCRFRKYKKLCMCFGAWLLSKAKGE